MTLSFRPRLDLLDAGEPARIVEDALLVLDRVGVRVEHEEGRDLLLGAGARPNGDRLRLAERIVRPALATCPATVPLYEREGALAFELGGDGVQFDPGSAALHLLDPATGVRRPPATADLVALARLVDALPHYAAQSTAMTPGDVPESIADRWRLYVALRHGRKPVVTGTFRADGFAPMRDLLRAARGGAAALAARPLAIFDCCPSPPLAWSPLTCDALLACAREGIPAELVSMPLAGAAAPVTLRESVVQHCAESLSGIVLHQLAGPGAPVIYGGAPAAFDMRHGTAPMGAIETMMIACAYAQVGRHLRLPVHGYLAVSDARALDYQAGLESGIGAVLGALAGVHLISGPGMLDYLLTQSLEKILLDHEACGMALRLVRGVARFECDVAALFGDLARLGEFLSHPHTRAHWREELGVASPLIDRNTWSDWEAAGKRTAEERARAECARLLAGPAGSPAPPDLARELDGIMAAEARRLGLADLPRVERD